jgi:hypothetical protein
MRLTKFAVSATLVAMLVVPTANFAGAARHLSHGPAPVVAESDPPAAALAPVRPVHVQKGSKKTPIKFTPGHVVDVQRLGAEPELHVDSQNNVYVTAPIGVQYAQSFLWKSEDNGDSFDLLRGSPVIQRPNPGAGSGDATFTFLPPANGGEVDALVWSDLVNLAGLQNAATFDGGNTFPPEYWNEYATQPGADRQWLAGMKIPGTETTRVWQWYDQVDINGNSVIYTDDYGKTWVDGQRGDIGTGNPGNMVADPVNKKLYLTWGDGPSVMVANGGMDANDFKSIKVAQGKSVATLFTVVDVDTAGNVYVVWSDGGEPRNTFLATSTDQGKTWSDPVTVNPPSQKTTLFPWIAAGDPGRVWVTWYGSSKPEAAPDNRGPWYAYASQSLNALSNKPKFKTVRVSDRINHDNEICLSGIGCTAGQAEDRNMLDDFTADIDPQGMLHVAYNDTNNQVTESTDADAGGAFIIETRQISGPSLYLKYGNVAPRLPKPKVKSAKVKSGVLHISGTQKMSPGNWAKDPKEDARDPRHGDGCPCENNPVLDIKQAWLSSTKKEAGNVVAHFRINNLPAIEQAVAQAGGKTPVYQTVFWIGGEVYYAQLEAVGPGRAYAGSPGPGIVNSAAVSKIADYTMDPTRTQDIDFTYTASEGKKPGKIDLVIPPDAIGGPKKKTKFDRVSFFVHTTAAGPTGETLMDERDGTYSTVWKLGAKRKPAGKVQISIDDARFSHPVTAKLVKYPKKGWTRTINVSKLRKGRHTVYVRTANGAFKSKVLKGHFTT